MNIFKITIEYEFVVQGENTLDALSKGKQFMHTALKDLYPDDVMIYAEEATEGYKLNHKMYNSNEGK
jgi:hypothetical protein